MFICKPSVSPRMNWYFRKKGKKGCPKNTGKSDVKIDHEVNYWRSAVSRWSVQRECLNGYSSIVEECTLSIMTVWLFQHFRSKGRSSTRRAGIKHKKVSTLIICLILLYSTLVTKMSCKLKDVSLLPAYAKMHGPKVKNEYPGSIMHGILMVENYRLDSIMHG